VAAQPVNRGHAGSGRDYVIASGRDCAWACEMLRTVKSEAWLL